MDATGMQPRPRLAALTWRGGWVLVGSLVLVVAGAVRVDGALAALGLAGWGGAAVAYAVGRWNLGRIAAEVEAPARVFAGATFPVRVTLHNRRVWLDGFGVEYALDLGGGGRAAGVARWIPAGAAADLVLRASVRVRGRHAAHDFRIASSFPLGLFRFRSDGRVAAPLLAFPRPLTPVELLAAGVRMDAAPLDGASPGDAPGEPRGLRGYRSGDRPRRIHWGATVRALAAGRSPVVRENDPPGFHPAHAHVVFHSFASGGELIRPDRFERALSLATGTLRHLQALGVPATFTADFLQWGDMAATTRARTADCLAAIAAARRAPDTEAHDLAAVLVRVPADHTLLILSDMPADAWQRHVPPRRVPPLVIDIRRHAGRGRRRLKLGGGGDVGDATTRPPASRRAARVARISHHRSTSG